MDDDLLAGEFERHRAHLRAVAARMLGSTADADDAVQEAWLRLSRSDAAAIDNLGGWLTTVVARICLNVLQSRRTHREEPWDDASGLPIERSVHVGSGDGAGGASSGIPGARSAPEDEALLGDAVGVALLVVLDTLTPSERLAFVLHDLFGVPFEQVAEVLGKSPAAARQLASRARRRVQGAADDRDDTPPADLPDGAMDGASSRSRRVRQAEVVEAFLAAAREGDFARLLELLDPGVLLRLDAPAERMGAQPAAGADAVARVFSGRAQAAEVAVLDGLTGLVWRHAGTLRVAFRFTLDDAGRVASIDMVADPETLADIDVVPA